MRKLYTSFISTFVCVALAAMPLSGCFVPNLGPVFSHDYVKELFYGVVRGVQCEIRRAVKSQLAEDREGRIQWLRNWSALIHLNFVFDTTVAFNPGVNLKTPMAPANLTLGDFASKSTSVAQSYGMGIGGQFSGEGILTEDVAFFYPFNKDFFRFQEVEGTGCYNLGGVMVTGDLALNEWLEDVLLPVRRCAFAGYPVPAPSSSIPLVDYSLGATDENPDCHGKDIEKQFASKDTPIRAFSHDVRFVLTLGGNVTPTWNLVRVGSPLNNPLFGVTRKDTSSLTITLGSPTTDKPLARTLKDTAHPWRYAQPSPLMLNQDLARQIGLAVRDVIP
jgi:hypothetical protein